MEYIPSRDISIWNLLHDGTIVGLTREGQKVLATIDISYLRSRFAEPGQFFVMELLDCVELEYTPYGESPISSLQEISAQEPEILEGNFKEGCVVVTSSKGILRLRYGALVLRFESGTPLSKKELDDCARRYWEEWGNH